ncbi:MAG: hypothetical protein LBI18_02145 [Planctomycetaceae bacterium]|nr:hypothetical protein [Planctomycetaceae bacterium]
MPCRLPILTGLTVLLFVLQGFTQTNNAENETTLTADVLISTLYAKTDAEKQYCEKIIRLRDEKILPNRIFYGIYRKSVTLEKTRRFTYFQTGLEILCQREGIVLERSASVTPTHLFGNMTKDLTVAIPEETTTMTEKQNPFSFIRKLFRSWYRHSE